MALEPGVLVIAALALVLLALRPPPAVAITLAPGFDSAALASGLAQPTAAAFAPDGRLFILEKAGAIRLWTPGRGLVAEPLAVLPSCTESEMGLLGVAVDPAFAQKGFLYLYHTHPPNGDVAQCGLGQAAGRENRVVRVTVTGEGIDLATLVVLFAGIRTDNGNHDGGGLRIGPDGLLYVGAGDSGRGDSGPPGAATNPYAQDVTVPNGKILRLALDGQPAPGNPFAGQGGAADFVFAYGLRNPFRFAFEPASGLLWVGDVGQNTWEEIDVVRAGNNLGWPQCEGPEPKPACPGATVPPVHAYNHDGEPAAITGGAFYDGAQFAPAYQGSYFFADFVLDIIWRAVPTPAHDGFTGAPQVLARRAGGPVDFLVAPDGALCYVAFNADEVRCITQARGGAADACTLGLGDAARGWLRRTARRIEACVRRSGTTCFPPPGAPRTPRGRVRALARDCGSPPPAPLCERLGCDPCGAVGALVACAAGGAAAAGAGLGAAILGGGAGRCARAAMRGGLGFAAERVGGITACVRGGGASCVPGGGDETRLARRLARACRRPPTEVCAALACAPCEDAAGLARCIAAMAGAVADDYAGRLFGGGAAL